MSTALAARAVPAPRKPAAHPKAELAAAAHTAVQRGFQAELPPHISTLLGLTYEEKCTVLQMVLRSRGSIQGMEVTEKNHNKIVIFRVDEASQDQIFYLTSLSGSLQRVLSVKQGVGHVVKPTKSDIDAFREEKKMWKERVVAQTTNR